MDKRLQPYRTKRDFTRTPEPAGGAWAGEPPQFVIQEHHASHLHWDFRLEHQGVLASWAVPRGLPLDPADRRLAVQTEDHPLSYASFEGTIPAGNYGAGEVRLWDHGRYECHHFDDRKVLVTLHGQRLEGKYLLFRTRGSHWLIRRLSEAPQEFDPFPPQIPPMLASPGVLPADPALYAFEIKWDGVRALAFIEGGRLVLRSRSGRDITSEYPEFRGLGEALADCDAVLDGEIVVLDPEGKPDFGRLQGRLGVRNARDLHRLTIEHPAVFMIFDLLYCQGKSLLPLSYAQRRRRLEALSLSSPSWRISATTRQSGAELLAAATRAGLEGIVAKRLDSPYLPGERTRAWIKIKQRPRQEFVIAGWLPGKSEPLGSLLLGVFSGDELVPAGRVGAGLSQEWRDRLEPELRKREIRENPFDRPLRAQGAHFCRPELVCEVEFAEWTHHGTLRQPSFKGLRDDKAPREVVRE